MVDHIVIENLVLLVVLVVLAAFEENVFDLLSAFGFAAVEIVQSALDEELVEVHLESSALEDVLYKWGSTY